MPIRIAISEPTSEDAAYNQRSLPPYLKALEASGATPVVISLRSSKEEIEAVLAGVDGILLPGSGFDVDPVRYGEARVPECGPADPKRATADETLLAGAFAAKKPVLAICHGTQTLNVWCGGTLYQDLPSQLGAQINHAPGRTVLDAHGVLIARGSRLGELGPAPDENVNSSHHQAVRAIGTSLKAVAQSKEDSVIEAIELDSPDHFVVGVQWHPERTFEHSPFSRAIFRSFIEAAKSWQTHSGGSGRG